MATLPTLLSRRTAWPWREFDVDNRLLRLFEEPFGEAEPFGWAPSVDVEETDDELLLTAELPGLEEKDVEIDVEGNSLTLRGSKKQEREEEKANGNRKMRIWERRYGEFTRSFTLPGTVDVEKIRAEFDKGILTVHMPKTSESKGRKIAIGARKK